MNKKPTRALTLAALAGIFSWSCLFQVQENESVIVARLGDPSRLVSEAGLAFKLPPPIDTLIRVDRRVRILEPEPVEYLTRDQKNVLVSCFVAWSVDDPVLFIRSARDVEAAEARIGDIALAELNNMLGSYPIAALVSIEDQPKHMEDLNDELTRHIAARSSQDFGVRVHCARIKRLNYPMQNKQAVFRRMEAERKKIAQEIRAEGAARADRIRSDATRQASLLLNEAERRSAELRGEGEAEATRIYGEAYSEDLEFYEFLKTLEAYDKMFSTGTTIVLPRTAPILRLLNAPPSPSGKKPGEGN